VLRKQSRGAPQFDRNYYSSEEQWLSEDISRNPAFLGFLCDLAGNAISSQYPWKARLSIGGVVQIAWGKRKFDFCQLPYILYLLKHTLRLGRDDRKRRVSSLRSVALALGSCFELVLQPTVM
jgi:hypothetical protein